MCSFLIVLAVAQPAQACKAYYASDSRRGDIINSDFNDFAFILDSAGDPYCAGAAALKLSTKLSNMQTSDWQTWLSGGAVSFIMQSGLYLGVLGELSPTLDQKIRDVANNYQFQLQKDINGNVTCGFDSFKWQTGNTCLEDYAMGASAHAWRAAYYRHTGRSEWTTARSAAITALSNMLAPDTSCIRKLDPNATKDLMNRGVCNGSYSDLTAVPPTGELVTLNHGQQSLAYGIGQMTSFASAVKGLDVAEKAFAKTELAADRIAMTGYLFAEASPRASTSGATAAIFSATACYKLDTPNMTLVSNWPCYDKEVYDGNHPSTLGSPTPYRADMFSVKAVYDRFTLPTNGASGYLFNRFNDIYLTGQYDYDKIWGIGRQHFYGWAPSINISPSMQGRPYYFGGIKRGTYFTTAGAGTNVTLGATTRTTAAAMTLNDNNYGSLRNGDTVSVTTSTAGWYWHATNGGGSSVVTVTVNPSPFTIVKITDTTQIIAGGDQFALRTASGYYLSAPTYGGNVTATATTIGTNEKFTLDRTKLD